VLPTVPRSNTHAADTGASDMHDSDLCIFHHRLAAYWDQQNPVRKWDARARLAKVTGYDANLSFRRPAPGSQEMIAVQLVLLGYRYYPVLHARSSVYTDIETAQRYCLKLPLQTRIPSRGKALTRMNKFEIDWWMNRLCDVNHKHSCFVTECNAHSSLFFRI
jgi:hypothetical protein